MNLVVIYLCLAGAILTEVIATTALAASEGLSKPLPSIISVICFVAAFWLLSYPLRTMPTGIVYAVWSGLGNRPDNGCCLGLGKAAAGRTSTHWHHPNYFRCDRNECVLEIRPSLTRRRSRRHTRPGSEARPLVQVLHYCH